MSNYYCAARMNYFRVDPAKQAAFDAFITKYKINVVTEDTDTGRVACLPGEWTDSGEFPSYDADLEDEGKNPEIDFIGTIATFLAPGSVAIIVEAGHDKLRYVQGYAVAIDHTGRTVEVSTNDIYKLAETAFPDAEITKAQY